jgi:hypothetical protein
MVLHKNRCKTNEQNKKPRNKSIKMWPTDFITVPRTHSGERIVFPKK